MNYSFFNGGVIVPKVKNSSLTIILIFFLSFLLLLKLYITSTTDDFVFNQIISFNNILSKKLVDNFFSDDNDIKESATTAIKKIVLHDLGYENWLNYIDFIDIRLYLQDVVHDSREDLIISVNLSKDQGVIGIYRLYEDKYILSNTIKDLCNIRNISSIKIGPSKKTFLITEEVLDEMIGAYFVDNFIRIFSEANGKFIEVFRQSVDYTAFYFEKWQDPNTSNPKWYKITENSVVDNITLEKENIVINISKALAKYENSNSSNFADFSNYKLISQHNYDIKLVWSEVYNSFILAEGKILSRNIDVGIIEDTTQTVDYLLNLTGKYYKVIDKDNVILYIDKNDIIITKDFSAL